jgi:hypothetical protein
MSILITADIIDSYTNQNQAASYFLINFVKTEVSLFQDGVFNGYAIVNSISVFILLRGILLYESWGLGIIIKREKFARLEKLTLLQVTLTNQHPSKVNSCDNNVEYSTSRIFYITISNMKLF